MTRGMMIVLLAGMVIGTSKGYRQVPVLSSDVYYGEVGEYGGDVDITPPITTDNVNICGYRIVNNEKKRLPFEVYLINQTEGQLRTRGPLNCEEQKNYTVNIVAVDCDGHISNSSEIQVSVTDVNEYIPVWEKDEYSGQVEEGEPNRQDVIVKVKATDKDCSHMFGTVCNYRINNSDEKFQVNRKGDITATTTLSTTESRIHVLSVVATDCGGKESSPVLVTITVIPKCDTKWTDVSTSMTYIPGTGPQPIFPMAKLSLCSSICPISRVETQLSFHKEDQEDGCYRDTYRLDSQQKLCGSNSLNVELLPDHAEWVTELLSDQGEVSGPGYLFDGTDAVQIPPSVMSGKLLGKEFTMSTWLRHKAKTEKHMKENILCLADNHHKNRPHVSLFVRNCKLVLLVRRNYEEKERNVFKPAEWRWRLPQVCDNNWHHYSVFFDSEKAELTIDGEPWIPEPNNPEVVDDWPLHPAADILTTLTVGACWHGEDNKMVHGLIGHLAGLTVLPGHREHSEVLKCLVQCSESLQLPATSHLQPGMEMVANRHGTLVTIDGSDVMNMNNLLRQVAYLNNREFPAPGRRRLTLATTVTCNDGTVKKVPTDISGILVLPVEDPTITISGTTNISRTYDAFKRGVRIFSDIKMSVSQKGKVQAWTKLDRCTVNVFPPLNPDHEKIDLPFSMIKSLNLVSTISIGGAEIRGQEMIYNYQQVVRQLTYSNQKPAYYLNRQFKIICSEQSERFISNEFMHTVTVIHPASETVEEIPNSHHQISSLDVPIVSHLKTSPLSHSDYGKGDSLVVMVVVCVCLIISLTIVGVIRLRAVNSREMRDQNMEMDWDDLNITVNPLEVTTKCSPMLAKNIEMECDNDLSIVEDMFTDESSDDDEDEDENRNCHRLEWDNDI